VSGPPALINPPAYPISPRRIICSYIPSFSLIWIDRAASMLVCRVYALMEVEHA